jgi:alcohol dehydrogenase
MQLGAALAGLAIENSMLGAAHALANPLTAAFGIAHGEAIAVMLPHVIRRNGREFESWYRELVMSSDDLQFLSPGANAAKSLADFVSGISRQAGLAGKLTEYDVPCDRLPELAAAATQQWTGTFNPVDLSERDFLDLYEAAL